MTGVGRQVGRYVIEEELGRGGMAVVYLAHQTGLERKVALKELSAFHAQDVAYAQRFLHESRLAGSLNHANIVTVFDYFEHEGVPYISMELVERGPLRPYLGKLSLAQTFGVLEGILNGLGVAHARGIVHRDLKPENVMVTWDGHVKIADFGIAKALDQMVSVGFSTGTGGVVGTPAYMAPEQAVDGEIGAWSDLYSLGVMAFEMLVGRLPFATGDTPLKVLMRHAVEPVPPPREINPDLDPYFAWWIERLLAKDPAGRFASAAEAWDALERGVTPLLGPEWRRQASLVSPAEAARPRRSTTTPVPVVAAGPPPVEQVRRAARVPLALGAGGVVGVVLALVFLLPGGEDPQRIRQVTTATADVSYREEVAAICSALREDRQDLPRRQRRVRRAIDRADTVGEQRDALLGEYKHLLSINKQLLPRLEAVRIADERARHVRRAGLRAWRRNIARLERRRDALDGARTFAQLQAAAAVRDRGAIEDDGVRLNRRLLQLAPGRCELGVTPTGPVITLTPPPEAVDPGDGSGDVAPAVPVPTVTPAGGDVAPSTPAGGDVAPPAVAPAPDGDVAPPTTGGGAGD